MQSNSKEREELERSAWSWVEEIQNPDSDPILEENLEFSYRLFFPEHISPTWKCKKNCRSNPKCYCALGETQWLLAEPKNGQENGENEEDMSLEKKVSGLPVGLKNLGNTCYVNSFLQIWFHNVPFRQALYKWDPSQDPLEAANETLLQAELYRPCGKVASLQALFAMMEFTNRRAVDPNDFIAKLGLDPQVQQDAAEFSKLFMSLLESSLSNQKSSKVRSIVQNQFRGQYAYVTRCCKCQNESETPSFFYELDLPLQGQKTLLSCLDDFLKEEKLEGDNQYYCNGCESKQDASRCVRLSKLPPVLNLQLNRFIFDMQTGRKKKLNSLVHFPEVLQMSSFLRQKQSDDNTYHLTGVLMHVGADANHGHYIAHIQEAITGQWFKFSDDFVEKLIGRFKGSEQDPLNGFNGHKAGKNGLKAGMQNSNNAYMLVYTSASSLAKIRGISAEKMAEILPFHLKAFIEHDIQQLEDDIKEQMRQRQNKQKEQSSLKIKMRKIYESLVPQTQKSIEFLPMEWLTQYFANPKNPNGINLTNSMCVHGKLDLNRIQDVKAVDSSLASKLYTELKTEPTKRLNHDSLCEPCVRNRCRIMKLARNLNDDHKLISEWLKSTENGQFWVGKLTLKKWRAMARENLDSKMKKEAAAYVSEHLSKLSKIGTEVIQLNAQNCDKNLAENFNYDMICQHGQMCIQEMKRKLVTEKVWQKLKSYFPDAREFEIGTKPCEFCLANDNKVKEAIEAKKEVANNQKLALGDIFNERSRPSWAKPNLNKIYLVPRSFIMEWKGFVRSPQFNEQVRLIPNATLLCEHGGLIYPLGLDTESDHESVVYMVSEEEWTILKEMFSVDQEISVTRNKGISDFLLNSEPPVCDECVAKRCREEEEELLLYRNVTIYVRRLTGGERPPEPDPSDPDFDYVNVNGCANTPKRFKMSNGHCSITNGSCSDFVRRSNRRQKVRGEREFTVSSDMLLRDLKVKIMEAFKVAPYDQNLCLNGQYLTDSGKTLGQLRVLPKSLIYLRADEPNPGILAMEPDDGWIMQHPEEGFKGTGLLEGS